MRAKTVLIAIAAVVAASPALGCAFHNYAPAPSLVERLSASPSILLARTSSEEPYRFADVVPVRGSGTKQYIPFLVDSATRRRLASSPEDRVLFAMDPNDGTWQRLAYVDADMRGVLDGLLSGLRTWAPHNPLDRYRFFADLLTHENDAVHTLALRELDTADYRTLKSLAPDIDASRLMARLNWRSELSLKPIRVLLLGFSQDVEAKRMLEAGVREYVRVGQSLLGAYATAAIERGGPETAVRLVNTYLIDPTIPITSREQLVEALAIQSNAAGSTMTVAVRHAVQTAIKAQPALAPAVARHFGARSDFSFAETVSDARSETAATSLMDKFILGRYVGMARAQEGIARPL